MAKLSLIRTTAFAVAALAALPAGRASAQASFTVGGDTDFRFRGVSLSNERAAARAGLAYDHRSGAYGGAVLVVGTNTDRDPRILGGTGYVGFARRTAGGFTTDVGVTATRISSDFKISPLAPAPYAAVYAPQPYSVSYRAEYAEAYAGVSRGDVSVYAYVSPNYLEPGQSAAYVEVNAAVHPAPRLRLFGHAGLVTPLEDSAYGGLKSRADVRLGLALELNRVELQLAWTGLSRQIDYPPGYPRDRDGLVLSATAYF